MNWDYLQPVKIHFGKGRVKEIKEIARELGCERGLLVAGPFFFKSGLAEKVIKESEGMIVASFGDVSPNPDVVEVDACAEVIRQKNIGFVVALGGGSPMDCAKAAASVALTSDSIRKYHGTGVAMPEKHLPLIAVPTTAGTGSEVTCVSVLSDHANGKKAPIVSEGFYPAAAIIDPELTYTMPPQVTAGTGIDVLSHAIEGYWSKGHQPICDGNTPGSDPIKKQDILSERHLKISTFRRRKPGVQPFWQLPSSQTLQDKWLPSFSQNVDCFF